MIQTEKMGGKEYVEQRVWEERRCTFCGEVVTRAMISWRHSGEVLHNQCFRRLQREDGK